MSFFTTKATKFTKKSKRQDRKMKDKEWIGLMASDIFLSLHFSVFAFVFKIILSLIILC